MKLKKKHYQIFGGFIYVLSLVMAWYFYGWQLSLLLFLAQWGNNIDLATKK